MNILLLDSEAPSCNLLNIQKIFIYLFIYIYNLFSFKFHPFNAEGNPRLILLFHFPPEFH